ncbi:MAG: tetratricopeptide repeat protein [Acidimicrobiales bacterium]|nr:tetratricopeptide repeat protein [Acidimicrobiales bacterium]
MEIDSLVESCNALMAMKRYSSALEIAFEIIRIDPENSTGYILAARSLMDLDRHREAMSEASKAVTLDPLNYNCHLIYSDVVSRSPNISPGEIGSAVIAAKEAIRLNPLFSGCYLALTNALVRAKDYKEANFAVLKAIELDPMSSTIWTTAGYVALRAKNARASERASLYALTLDPNNALAISNLGYAMELNFRWTVGAVAYFNAAKIDPKSSLAVSRVEGIGFSYFRLISTLCLLPLMLVPPAYFIAVIGLNWWWRTKPARVKPAAQRLGIGIATSRRSRERYERYIGKIQREIRNPKALINWSAIRAQKPTPGRRYEYFGAAGLAVMLYFFSIYLVAGGVKQPNVNKHAAFVGSIVLAILALILTVIFIRWVLKERKFAKSFYS